MISKWIADGRWTCARVLNELIRGSVNVRWAKRCARARQANAGASAGAARQTGRGMQGDADRVAGGPRAGHLRAGGRAMKGSHRLLHRAHFGL